MILSSKSESNNQI